MENIKEKRSWLNNTILFLMTLILCVVVFSVIGSVLNFEGSYPKLNTVTGNVENSLVSVESLLELLESCPELVSLTSTFSIL